MQSREQAIDEARKAGIDLDLVDLNLALTYDERVLRHASALELVQALKQSAVTHEQSASAAATAR